MTEDTQAPSLSRLVKLVMKSTASNDNEALMALRLAHKEADKFGGWETILRGKITVIGDPFAELGTPPRNAEGPTYSRPMPPSRPAAPTPQPAAAPYQNRPQAPSNPRPAQPAPRQSPASRRRRRQRQPLPDLNDVLNTFGIT